MERALMGEEDKKSCQGKKEKQSCEGNRSAAAGTICTTDVEIQFTWFCRAQALRSRVLNGRWFVTWWLHVIFAR
jgi:hypothetical protein